MQGLEAVRGAEGQSEWPENRIHIKTPYFGQFLLCQLNPRSKIQEGSSHSLQGGLQGVSWTLTSWLRAHVTHTSLSPQVGKVPSLPQRLLLTCGVPDRSSGSRIFPPSRKCPSFKDRKGLRV